MTENKQPKVCLVRGDDWEAIYVDGKLVDENHSLSAYDVLTDVLDKENIDGIDIYDEAYWEKLHYALPKNLDDLKKVVKEVAEEIEEE